jgi:hypothetical protein
MSILWAKKISIRFLDTPCEEFTEDKKGQVPTMDLAFS